MIEEFVVINSETREIIAKVNVNKGIASLASGYNLVWSKGEKIDYKKIDGKYYVED